MQSDYQLTLLSSMQWVALRLELMTNLATLAVALFVAFSTSSVSHSYKAMAVSLILPVREDSDSGGVVCGRRRTQGIHGTSLTPWTWPCVAYEPCAWLSESAAPSPRHLCLKILNGVVKYWN